MDNTFILYNTYPDGHTDGVLLFRDPLEIVCCRGEDEISPCFDRIERALSEGHYVAGFLSYELGLYFNEIPFERGSHFPLFCFGVFSPPEKIPVKDLASHLDAESSAFKIQNDRYTVEDDRYNSDIAGIKEHLLNGNTYQVNHTFKYKFDFSGSSSGLFSHLLQRQEVPYAAFFEHDNWAIASLSPELFFRREGRKMTVRPMKGTIDRGMDNEEDLINLIKLSSSDKDRAENLMIVDLLRSDLGRISETGSVRTESLFDIEKYRTVFQMTSTVRSRLKKDISWEDIFRNIFPSGSVTGAPKKRTMEIILGTEKEERDIYTGSMGYISPRGEALFNVAIRTVLIDKTNGKGEMGIGSGIVYDSIAEKEFAESMLKGHFLTNKNISPSFELIETLLWEEGEFFLLERHLERLEGSAKYFSFQFSREDAASSLKETSRPFDPGSKYRVRLLLGKDGNVSVSSDVLKETPHPVTTALSSQNISKQNFFLRHKTTNRGLYDQELEKAREKGLFDVIFLNEEGEVTEGAITNVIIRKGSDYFTPPVSSGLLGGVYRAYLLEKEDLSVKEKVLRAEDLENADEIFLVNSVRKMMPAVLAG